METVDLKLVLLGKAAHARRHVDRRRVTDAHTHMHAGALQPA